MSKRKTKRQTASQKILWLLSVTIVGSMVISLVIVALPSDSFSPTPPPLPTWTRQPTFTPTPAATALPFPTLGPSPQTGQDPAETPGPSPTMEATEPAAGPVLPTETPEATEPAAGPVLPTETPQATEPAAGPVLPTATPTATVTPTLTITPSGSDLDLQFAGPPLNGGQAMIKTRCFKCGTAYQLTEQFVANALAAAGISGKPSHYASECPQCRQINKIPLKRVRLPEPEREEAQAPEDQDSQA